VAPPCTQQGGSCSGNTTCCGAACCTDGQLCCMQDGPVTGPMCFTPTTTQTTCPPGCPTCQ
jgi:hypothetical protein